MISLCLMGIFLFVTFLQNVHMFVYICVCVCLHVCWVFTAAQDFLQLWWAGSTLRCDLRASHCSGFSCCGAWALGTQASVVTAHWLSCCNFQAPELGSVVVVHGLIASQHVGSSWTRNHRTYISYSGTQTLIHCANKEVPCVCTFLMYLTVSHSLAYLLHLAR